MTTAACLILNKHVRAALALAAGNAASLAKVQS